MSRFYAFASGGIDIVSPPKHMGMFSSASDMAIDLGTANTCIYTRGAVALSEPSVVAFNTANGGIEAVGAEARDMLGRTPPNITPVWPVRNGVIADFEAVERCSRTSCAKRGTQLFASPARNRCAGGEQPGGTPCRQGKCEPDAGQ